MIHPERDRHWPIPLSAVSSIPCQYADGRFVVAHAAKELPGGSFSPVGVALAKAVKDLLTSATRRDSVSPTTESGGRAGGTAGPLDEHLHGGVASA